MHDTDWISNFCKTVALLEIKGNLSRIYTGIEKLLTILSWLCKTGIFWNQSSGTWSPVLHSQLGIVSNFSIPVYILLKFPFISNNATVLQKLEIQSVSCIQSVFCMHGEKKQPIMQMRCKMQNLEDQGGIAEM